MRDKNDESRNPKEETKEVGHLNKEAATKPSGQTPPKEKRRKVISECIAKIEDRELRGELRGLTEMLLTNLDETESENKNLLHKEKLNYDKGRLNYEKEKLDAVIYCNVFRRQMERFETHFSKHEFHVLFSSFRVTLRMMVPIFNIERKNKDAIIFDEKASNVVFQSLTRVEKWRVIVLWFFFNEILQIQDDVKVSDCEKSLLSLLGQLKETIAREKGSFADDAMVLTESSRLDAIVMLRNKCVNTFKIVKSKGMYFAVLEEIRGISQAFHEGFQRCSKELKRFENVVFSDAECMIPRKMIGASAETEDSSIINQCMDLLVDLGKKI